MATWDKEEDAFKGVLKKDAEPKKDLIRKEEESVKAYLDDAKDNETLKKHDIGFYKRSDYENKINNAKFYKGLSIFLTIILILSAVAYFFFASKGYFKAEYHDNSSINISVPQVTLNDTYNNNFNYNENKTNHEYVNVYLNLSGDLGEAISEQMVQAFIDKFELNMSAYT